MSVSIIIIIIIIIRKMTENVNRDFLGGMSFFEILLSLILFEFSKTFNEIIITSVIYILTYILATVF